MKKRLLASVMSLCMILSLLPVSAFAEEPGTAPESEPACICNVQCTEDTQNTECPVCAEDIAGCTAPAQVSDPEETTPTQDDQTPEEDSSAPTEEPSQPTEPNQEPTTPEEDPAAPVEDSTDSTQETAGTAEDPAAPVQDPSDNGGLPDNEEPIIQNEPTPQAGNAVYVSATGIDETGDGSQGNPYATLAKAVDVAEDGATIYVATDLELDRVARIINKNLTITSANSDAPVTLTRSETFAEAGDTQRGSYNPPMIEVLVYGNSSLAPSSVRLENIILDDQMKYTGTVFQQAQNGQTEDKYNTHFVQEAMIAAHGLSSTSTATITLGEGAILQNYGGMSAVRVTTNAILTMENGSIIQDTDGYEDRTKGKDLSGKTIGTGDSSAAYGPMGAVWVQGATFEMQSGSYIQNMGGRGIYADLKSNVDLDGTIQDITSTIAVRHNYKRNSWQFRSSYGIGIHLRGNSSLTLGSNFVMSDISVTEGSNDSEQHPNC